MSPNDERSDEETRRLSDAVLKRMLATNPSNKKRAVKAKKPKKAKG